MSWLDELTPASGLVERLRAPKLDNRYSGQDDDLDWDRAVPTPIEGAWVGGSTSRQSTDLSRTQYAQQVSLFCPPDTDLRTTDRIRVGGHTFEIEGIPYPEVHPFTGWRPPLEVPLGREVG
jgi:hypothetical protein